MENKKKFPLTNIGTVTLLMIFIVICMVVFTVLTLSESAADYNFSKKLSAQTTNYYEACSKAEGVLEQIDIAVSNDKSVYDAIADQADDVQVKGSIVTYSFPVNKQLLLTVAVKLTKGSDSGNYEILKWEEVRVGEWQGNNDIELIKP